MCDSRKNLNYTYLAYEDYTSDEEFEVCLAHHHKT